MKIVLLGYMASGKSTIGKHLAESMQVPFVDLDMYIETQEKMTIKSIFKEKGEIYFRKIEHLYLKELLEDPTNTVLSLGGGAPCYAGNIDLISTSKALSIYLQASIATLSNRLLKEKNNRPLIADLHSDAVPEFVAKHLFERVSFYEKATYKIKIDEKEVKTIVSEIETLLQ